MKKDYLRIINKHGVLAQMKHWYTEVMELTKEIVDKENSRDIITPVFEAAASLGFLKEESRRNKIKSELADNFNFLKQFQYYYGITDAEIIEECKFKNKRTLEEMEKDK